MDTREDNSKPFSPVKAICLGVLCFGLASFALWTGIVGLMSGETRPIAKWGAQHLIFRRDTPDKFWFFIAVDFILAVIVFYGAVILIVGGVKRMRR